MQLKKQLASFDFTLLLLVLGISAFGVIIIGSATRINIYATSDEFKSQIIWIITGFVLMLFSAFIDYRTICRFYIPIYILNIVLLLLVLFIGTEANNATRWLFGIQPSEFSKVFMIICLAKFIDKNQEKINNISIILFIFAATLIPVILIMKQPSLSASIVTLSIMIVLLFAGRISFKYIGVVIMIVIPVAVVLFLDLMSEEHFLISRILKDYQINRIMSNINIDLTSNDQATYQTRNSIWAIGSGQLQGKGLYNGTINQLSYLPYSHNDFIYSVIGEEFGFIGSVLVLAVMLLIILKCFSIASKAVDNLGYLLACGVAGMFAFQVFVNVGVATGLLPNTGMPFPFLSYGGSSTWINMIAVGLVLNVGMRKPKSMFKE